MARSGSAPAASKAASGREPIILRGFDRHRQLDINFKTVPFGACWLRRSYTNEQHNHITLRARNDERRLQEVRYGNNITVLLKACYHMRRFYSSPDFWPAIAQGFGASADVIKAMAELIADARKIYYRNNPDEDDSDRSGANLAADRWLDFLANTRRDSGTRRYDEYFQAPRSEVYEQARYFFRESEGKQVDLANVLPKKVEPLHYSPPDSRKRFASPEPPEQPPSPKRRPSHHYFDRTDPLPARHSQPLAPLETAQVRESAKQEYQTPTSASDRLPWFKPPPEGSQNDATKVFQKIRGTSAQNRNGLPTIESCDLMPKHTLLDGSSDAENKKLRDRVATLEKELFSMKSRLSNDQHHRDLVHEILSDHGLITSKPLPSTPDPAVKTLQAQVASLDCNIAEEAECRAQDVNDVKESIQSAKSQIALLVDNLMKQKPSASGHDQDLNPALHIIENVRSRLAFLEHKLLVEGTKETQTKIATLGSRIATIQSEPQKPNAPIVQDAANDSTRPEISVMARAAKEHRQSDSLGMWDKISRLQNGIDTISDRVTKIETKPGEGEHIHELNSRIAVIELRQDRDQERYATKNLVETTFEQLESRLAREKDTAAEQLRNLHQRLMAIEIQRSRLPETVDVPKTSENLSTSPRQQDIDEILKTISSLPTTTSISDMIERRAQIMQTDIDKVQHKVDDASAKIKGLPNPAHISERTSRIEQSLRAELGRHQTNVTGLVDGVRKDLETLRIQIKSLNKLWNEATTGTAKSESLHALELEVNALKADVLLQSQRFNDSDQNMDKAKKDTVANLERQIADLSTQISTAVSELTPENMLKRLQEVRSNSDGQSAFSDARVDGLVLEIKTLHARDSILSKALNDVGQRRA